MSNLLDHTGKPISRTLDRGDDKIKTYAEDVFDGLTKAAGDNGYVSRIAENYIGIAASAIAGHDLLFTSAFFSVAWPSSDFASILTMYLYPMHCPPPPDFEMLPTTDRCPHACISASVMILNALESKQQVYEGVEDGTINVRQIVQSTAQLYNVDPTEMMAHYPAIRWCLHSGSYVPPASIETAVASKKEKVRNTDGLSVKVN